MQSHLVPSISPPILFFHRCGPRAPLSCVQRSPRFLVAYVWFAIEQAMASWYRLRAASIQSAKLHLFNIEEILDQSFCINAFWQSSVAATVVGNDSALEVGSLSRVEAGSAMDRIHVRVLGERIRLRKKTHRPKVAGYFLPRAKRVCVRRPLPELPPWASAETKTFLGKYHR